MKRILIIDDDEDILTLIRQFLEKQDFNVTTGTSGDDLWAALEIDEFDLVILDVMLPGTDGLTLCRELRSQSDVAVIMLTALDEDTDRIVGLEIGADDYMVKPFNPRELLARMRAIFRRGELNARSAPDRSPQVFRFASFTFDSRKRELRSEDDLVVHLSRSEFDLLKIFVTRPQEVLDRNDLSEMLRGYSLEAFDRSIDLHVSRLRSKLGPVLGSSDFIKTVRGMGYLFDLEVQLVS